MFNQEQTHKRLAKMIITHEYPFTMAKHKGFIKFMNEAQPQLQMPRRKTIENDCIRIFKKLNPLLISKIAKDASQIALTTGTDLWMASHLTGYMVVTENFINSNWDLIR